MLTVIFLTEWDNDKNLQVMRHEICHSIHNRLPGRVVSAVEQSSTVGRYFSGTSLCVSRAIRLVLPDIADPITKTLRIPWFLSDIAQTCCFSAGCAK